MKGWAREWSAPFQILKKWVRVEKRNRLNLREMNLSDISLLSIEETLERMSGDRELLANLFQLFVDDAPKKLRAIEDFVAQNEFYQVERTAHSLKGASATVGATRLCRLAADLEQAAKAGSREQVDALRANLTPVCEQTLESMRRFCAE